MAASTEGEPRDRPAEQRPGDPTGDRTAPMACPTIQTTAPPPGEPMDVTPTNSSAPAAAAKSPGKDVKPNGGASERPQPAAQQNEQATAATSSATGTTSAPAENVAAPAPAAAAPAVHQPKIVQTAFIHKLYKCAWLPVSPRPRFSRCAC